MCAHVLDNSVSHSMTQKNSRSVICSNVPVNHMTNYRIFCFLRTLVWIRQLCKSLPLKNDSIWHVVFLETILNPIVNTELDILYFASSNL